MTNISDMLSTLLRLSLNIDKDIKGNYLSVFDNTENEDWEQLFDLSVKQGVLLLAYGGLQYLSVQQQPPRKLKLRWCVNVVKGSERYDHYKNIVARLSTLLSRNNIDLLLIKGITISELYPVPYFRESGDIDIYLPEKTEKANNLISTIAIQKDGCIAKHSVFVLEGILIENHHTFFDTSLRFRKESELYQKMENILKGMFSEDAYPAVNGNNISRLHPQAAALYFIGHTFRHFCCLDVNIRQMCDWTVFFSNCKKDIDSELLSSQIEELGLSKFVCHINSFCSGYLGFRPYFIIPQRSEAKAEQLILGTIMHYRTNPKMHIPVVDVLCYLFRRNRIYQRYLDKVSISDFLFPEIKSYLIYLIKRRWRTSKKSVA